MNISLALSMQVERLDGLQHLRIPGRQQYVSPGEAYVEGDASSASYFLAGAAITGGTITVEGCGSDSLQGDVRFAEVCSGASALGLLAKTTSRGTATCALPSCVVAL